MLVRFRDIYEKADLTEADKDVSRLALSLEKKKKSLTDDRHSEE